MSYFKPNLPQDNAIIVVMSTNNKELVKRVEELGVKVLPSENLSKLLIFEKYHTDLQFLHYNKDTVFVLKECTSLKENLKKYFPNVIEISKNIDKDYPNNVMLSCVVLNDKLICNSKTIADEVLQMAIKDNLKIINVNQGYTKCSTCIVSENAIITSDKSIYKSCRNEMDVLLIRQGYIELSGTDYGFIGGSSFKYNRNTLVFTGNIKLHPDYESIKSFAQNHNVELISLTENTMIDIGSIIPID